MVIVILLGTQLTATSLKTLRAVMKRLDRECALAEPAAFKIAADGHGRPAIPPASFETGSEDTQPLARALRRDHPD